MNKGGRKRDSIWAKFQEIEEKGTLKAKCNACGHVQIIKACRMRAHVNSCQQLISNPVNNVADKAISQKEKDQLEALIITPSVPDPEVENVAKR